MAILGDLTELLRRAVTRTAPSKREEIMQQTTIDSLLQDLADEGAKFPQPLKPEALPEVEAWYAASAEALRVSLPDSSELLQAFGKIWRADRVETDPSLTSDDVKRTIAILRKARVLSSIYKNTASTSQSGDYASAVEREVKLLLGTFFPKTPWFVVPLLALVAAVGYALYGSFQIRDLRVDIRSMADSASERARKEITATSTQAQASIRGAQREAEDILRDARQTSGRRFDSLLTNHTRIEEARITASATERITDLNRAPILDSLSGRVSRLGGQTASLTENIDSAERTLRTLSADARVIRHSIDSLAPPVQRERLRSALDAVRVTQPVFWSFVAGLVVVLILAASALYRTFR